MKQINNYIIEKLIINKQSKDDISFSIMKFIENWIVDGLHYEKEKDFKLEQEYYDGCSFINIDFSNTYYFPDHGAFQHFYNSLLKNIREKFKDVKFNNWYRYERKDNVKTIMLKIYYK